jgi:hypothetical protein
MQTKQCPSCLTDFYPKKKKQIYCSADCVYAKTSTLSLDRSCANPDCGSPFTVAKRSDKKQYCSRSCSTQVNNKKFPKREKQGQCEVCQKPVPVHIKNCALHRKAGEKYSSKPQSNTCLVCKNEFLTLFKSRKVCNNCEQTLKTLHNLSVCVYCGSSKSSQEDHCEECVSYARVQRKIARWLRGDLSQAGDERKTAPFIRGFMLDEAGMKCSQCGFDTLHPVDGSCVLEVDHIDGNGENHAYENLRVLCPNCHALTPTYRGRNAGSGRKVFYTRTVRSS